MGDANTWFAVWLALVAVRVPVVVTGEPLTVNSAGKLRATEVTVPVLAVAPVATPSNLVLSAPVMNPAAPAATTLACAVAPAPTWAMGAASAAISALTKAVVAIEVSLSPWVAVGAVGVPVKAGLLRGARLVAVPAVSRTSMRVLPAHSSPVVPS